MRTQAEVRLFDSHRSLSCVYMMRLARDPPAQLLEGTVITVMQKVAQSLGTHHIIIRCRKQ